ncbi:MAG: N-succinylarginine dihydrolase [Myxococcota bacterium]
MAMEFNFDGLVGPSHNYGGLSFGNIASQASEGQLSRPKEAALQGLAKMRLLHELGVPQAVIPPHMRPDLGLARRIGFSGSEGRLLATLAAEAPLVLAACYSASAMWTANAATVSASADTRDGRVHFTPANLQNKVHRSIEPPTTRRILKAIFADEERFAHHEPLPGTAALGDEGAANHTRFAKDHDVPGLELFVYGESAANPFGPRPKVFPARQTKEACEAIVRLHGLTPSGRLILQQSPEVIDQGVFHNDVIAVGHLQTLFAHEKAFEDSKDFDRLRRAVSKACGFELKAIVVREEDVPVADAVSSYIFNSQLVRTGSDRLALIAPMECKENERVHRHLEAVVAGPGGFDEVHYVELRQSMQGGGGPACLRLRVPMSEVEAQAFAPGVRFGPELHARLQTWVEAHYVEVLSPRDLADPAFVEGCRVALDELTGILGLGAIYPFQL